MENHSNMLKFLLSKSPVKQKIIMLKSLDVEQGRFLSELVANVLYGVLPITSHYKRRLRHFKTLWSNLVTGSANSRVSLISKNVTPVIVLLKAVSKIIDKIV
jgi:hypothetical protein